MRNFLFLIILSFSLSNCHKDNIGDGFVRATLLRYDLRECACCGGVMVHFDDPTLNSKDEFYQWFQNTNTFGINEFTAFPLSVKIKYNKYDGACASSKGVIKISGLIKL
ncbi:MAG TPA: hypothetical protein PK076_11450 [Saprospiraceae bacterium]|nr:hypothetical protein [Saprospiraceae bacterium]